ncbi:MAG: ATP-binding protein [Pseudomonadota bacterium]
MIQFWPSTLFGRNILILAGTIILSVSLSFLSIYIFILNAQLNRVTSIGAELINALSGVSFELDKEAKQALIAELDDSRYLQILPPGAVPAIGNYQENPAEKMVMQRLIDQLEYQNEMDWRIGANRTLWLNLRIGDEHYWVAAETDTTWTPMRWLIFFLFVIVGVVTMIGVFATRQISKPLAALKQETDQWSLGSNFNMAQINGPAEITALASSFQQMSERLQRAETVRSKTLAELSHDLRTPLARLRLAVEMMSEDNDLKDSASRQIQQIDRLIGQFMDYARAGRAEEKAMFDLGTLVQDAADHLGVEAEIETPLSITGQQEYIRRALINLIENAQKYGAPPVRVKLLETPTHAVIEVCDQGEGFNLSQTHEMLQSFKRGDHEAHISGSGLGLTIVDRVASAHDGEITFSKADPAGFRASFRLAL